jgi:hypothetical protein
MARGGRREPREGIRATRCAEPRTVRCARTADRSYQPPRLPGVSRQLSARLIVRVPSEMVTGWIT